MRLLFLQIITFLHVGLCAQGWQKHFRLPNMLSNIAQGIYETTPGNYLGIGLGTDSSNGGYSTKLCIMGLGNSGQLQWTKKYGNLRLNYLESGAITKWGTKIGNHIFLAAPVNDTTNSFITGALMKFNFNGDTLWQKTFRDSGYDFVPYCVCASIDGGLLVGGCFSDSATPLLIMKTDANGNELWRKKIHKAIPDFMDARAIMQDSASKKIIITGTQLIGNASSFDSYDLIMILDSLGNSLQQVHHTPVGGGLQALVQTSDKKFVAVGQKVYGYNAYYEDLNHFYVVKFDMNSPVSPIWRFEQPINNESFYSCVSELPDGHLLLAGQRDSTNGLYAFGQIDRLSSSGSLISSALYDFNDNPPSQTNLQELMCLNPTSDGGWIAAIADFTSSDPPNIFVKFDSIGCDSSAAYCAQIRTSIKTQKWGNAGISVYPNPFCNTLTIKAEAAVQLTGVLYDVRGKVVRQLSLQAKDNIFDTKDLQNGFYILKLENVNSTQSFQLKLMKQD